MSLLDRLVKLDRAFEDRAGGRRPEVPGHLPMLGVAALLNLLGIGAAVSGDSGTALQFVFMGIGVSFGASMVAFAVRRASRKT